MRLLCEHCGSPSIADWVLMRNCCCFGQFFCNLMSAKIVSKQAHLMIFTFRSLCALLWKVYLLHVNITIPASAADAKGRHQKPTPADAGGEVQAGSCKKSKTGKPAEKCCRAEDQQHNSKEDDEVQEAAKAPADSRCHVTAMPVWSHWFMNRIFAIYQVNKS